jgi:multimeric flavodoxin WrbA
MKVLAFNCSPKAEKANTSLILNPFLKGLESEGVQVELYYTRKLKIRPCSRHCGCGRGGWSAAGSGRKDVS